MQHRHALKIPPSAPRGSFPTHDLSGALGSVLQLFDCDGAVLHVPLLIAYLLHEVGLRLDHHNAAAEICQRLGQRFHRLDVEVIGRLVHRDEVRLRPKHGGEGEPDLLASGEAPDLLVAAHFFVDAEGLAMPHDLAACERSLVEARGLRRNAFVAGDDHLVEAHGLEFREFLDGVLLGVVEASPFHLVSKLVAHLGAADEVLDLVAVLAELLGQLLPPVCLFLVLGLDEALLQVAVVAVLEALRDVSERRSVEEGPQRLEVVLLHVGQAEVAVTRHLAKAAVLVFRRAHLAAKERHERTLAATVAAANRDAGVEAELHVAIPHEVLLLHGVAEGQVLRLQDGA
mmetsp:Transcript_63722/g.177212  ORF Transcript_63722/g.177212 Transcript_63722/m.177212 type:complete len:343 (-) Transcript_63722:64-1092(-)